MAGDDSRILESQAFPVGAGEPFSPADARDHPPGPPHQLASVRAAVLNVSPE